MNLRALVGQFLKFGMVGALAFVIDYGVLMLLSQVVGWDPVISSVFSFVISLVFNYVASMRFVFERREDLSRRREFTIFVVLSVIGLLINSACMWAGTAAFGDGALSVTVTKVAATAVVAIWNFVSRKRWLEA
ncbi:sugar translocase [Olsenella sp. An285]|uniref:GtrA family protein n=1 Tax=Olsenella sp. An285 TaxID=1965621 RepID=UPI000B399C3E|nr:GtrA family protein [Olsenella sp. An285]OUO46812.1 sugar translocase [Olsenella sp. An285]